MPESNRDDTKTPSKTNFSRRVKFNVSIESKVTDQNLKILSISIRNQRYFRAYPDLLPKNECVPLSTDTTHKPIYTIREPMRFVSQEKMSRPVYTSIANEFEIGHVTAYRPKKKFLFQMHTNLIILYDKSRELTLIILAISRCEMVISKETWYFLHTFQDDRLQKRNLRRTWEFFRKIRNYWFLHWNPTFFHCSWMERASNYALLSQQISIHNQPNHVFRSRSNGTKWDISDEVNKIINLKCKQRRNFTNKSLLTKNKWNRKLASNLTNCLYLQWLSLIHISEPTRPY